MSHTVLTSSRAAVVFGRGGFLLHSFDPGAPSLFGEGKRTVTLTGYILAEGSTPAARRDFLTRARGLLLRVAADTEGFTLTHEGRSMALRCTEAPQFSTDAAFAAGDAAFFTLRAEGRDGICFSGPSVSAAGRGVLGGVRFPHAITEETVFASMVRDGEMSVYNGGDCPCGFVAAVTAEGGGLDAFSLRLDGDVITVSHPLAEGESVVIDTRPGQKSVTADGASILEQTDWQSVFFSLQPGENRIGWSAVGGGRAAVRLTFTPLYL